MKKNLGRNRLKTILEAIVLENDKNTEFRMGFKVFHDGIELLHKGLKNLVSIILNFIVILLISSSVGFLFYCFDHSMKPWEVVFKINRAWRNDGKID